MATWYVRTTGSDSNGGTSKTDAFLTIGKAMTQASLVAGDTIWVGAGTYRLSATIAPTSMASMTYLYADSDGAKTGDAGEVVVSTYGSGDSAVPASVPNFTFASVNYWTIRGFTIFNGLGGSVYAVSISFGSHDLTFQDCYILSMGNPFVTSSVTFGVAQNILIERCRIISATSNAPLFFSTPTSASGADTNLNILVRNCVLNPGGVYVSVVGTATFKSGGITLRNCFISGSDGQNGILVSSTSLSSTYKVYVYNSFVASGPYAFSAAATGQIVEDYNYILGNTGAYQNTTGGANSITNSSRAFLFSVGHEASFGGIIRPFAEPTVGSPLLAWGGSSPATDDINGVTRPASGAGQSSTGQALGPFERANSATKEGSIVHAGANSIKIAGPGYQDFALPVTTVSTTVTVYGYYDASYTGTLPQMLVANGGECGVANASVTQTGAASTWTQLSLNFTPTSAGIVTIRLQSNSTAAAGNAYFDDFAVA